MIKCKQDLIRYMEMDRIALGISKKVHFLKSDIWKFEIILRKHEYYINCKKNNIMRLWYSWMHYRYGIKLGFSIPCNVFGGG